MAEIRVRVEAEINPTENEEKVKLAVNNILGNSLITIKSAQKQNILIAESEGRDSLIKLRSLFRNDRIRDAARKALFRNTVEKTINFCLNKQVAAEGHISFSEARAESPLGPLCVTIKTDNPRQLVEWLAEKTEVRR